MTQRLARSTKQIGAIVGRQRRQKQLSQADLADQLGLRQATISAIESGMTGTRISTLLNVLAALDLEFTVGPRIRGRRRTDRGCLLMPRRPTHAPLDVFLNNRLVGRPTTAPGSSGSTRCRCRSGVNRGLPTATSGGGASSGATAPGTSEPLIAAAAPFHGGSAMALRWETAATAVPRRRSRPFRSRAVPGHPGANLPLSGSSACGAARLAGMPQSTQSRFDNCWLLLATDAL